MQDGSHIPPHARLHQKLGGGWLRFAKGFYALGCLQTSD
jgi:hypothetical protein